MSLGLFLLQVENKRPLEFPVSYGLPSVILYKADKDHCLKLQDL